MSLFKSKTAGF